MLGGDLAGPLSSGWSRFSEAVWGLPFLGSSAWGWRLESLLGLCALAVAARAVVFRFLSPWLGDESAGGAALVVALVVPLHPLSALAVAELSGRAEIAGAFLSLCAGMLFLKGRQEQREGFVLAAFPVLIVAGFASSHVLPMALVLATGELCAVRRHRRWSLRLRTATTTAFLFGLAAFLPRLLVEGLFSLPTLDAPLGSGGREIASAWGDTLGEMVLPERGLGSAGTILAGALLVLALRPAFRAARHAPRLWGRLFFVWALILLLALVGSRTGEHAPPLLAMVAWCAGLGLAISPLRPPRRQAMILVLALGFAALTHMAALPWSHGARAQAQLCKELQGLSRVRESAVLVLDPPEMAGLPELGRGLSWALHPRLDGRAGDRSGGDGGFDPTRVQALSGRAFLALVSSEVFAGIRARGPLVVARTQPPGGPVAHLTAVSLPALEARQSSALAFRGLTWTPPTALDPLQWEQVSLVAELAVVPREIEGLVWQTTSGGAGSLVGRVTERGGRRVSEFDLASSLDWRLAGQVRSVLVEQGIRGIERGEFAARLPELLGVGSPVVEEADWLFASPPSGALLEPGGRLELSLLPLANLRLLVLPVERDASGGLRVPGAARFAASHARPEAPVCWLLDYRVGSRVLLRARGCVP